MVDLESYGCFLNITHRYIPVAVSKCVPVQLKCTNFLHTPVEVVVFSLFRDSFFQLLDAVITGLCLGRIVVPGTDDSTNSETFNPHA